MTCVLAQSGETTSACGWVECGGRKSSECVASTQKLPEHGSHSATTISSVLPSFALLIHPVLIYLFLERGWVRTIPDAVTKECGPAMETVRTLKLWELPCGHA